MYALCLGDADIKNVKATDFSITATGVLHTQGLTGFGFAPDVMLFLRCQDNTALPQNYAVNFLTLGVATKAGDQLYLEPFGIDASSPASTFRGMISTAISSFGGNNLTFASMDADGCTVNVPAGWTTCRLIVFAIKGGRWKLGTSAKPTGAAPATHAITGVGFPPRGGMLLTAQLASLAAFQAHMEASIGLVSGQPFATTGQRAAIARVDRNAANPTFSKRYQDSAKALIKVDNATPAVDAAADIASFDADGITLTWNPNDAVATIIAYLLVGDDIARAHPGIGVVRGSPVDANRGRHMRGARGVRGAYRRRS